MQYKHETDLKASEQSHRHPCTVEIDLPCKSDGERHVKTILPSTTKQNTGRVGTSTYREAPDTSGENRYVNNTGEVQIKLCARQEARTWLDIISQQNEAEAKHPVSLKGHTRGGRQAVNVAFRRVVRHSTSYGTYGAVWYGMVASN